MATNDYGSYMRATEEYRRSDTLQHAGKKGMKWGISHTPGYKAIGQKAKGILDAMGNYIYNTYNKLTSKSTPAPSTAAGFNAVKLAEIAEQRKAEARKADEELKKKEEEPKMEVHVQEFHRPTPTEGPKEPQKDDLKEDEHGQYRIVDGEKHYDLGDGKEYLYADGTFFEVGGTGKTVPEGKTPEPPKAGEREPSDRMVDDDGNLKLLDQYGPYFDADGEKHYDIEGKDYYYSDGLYFPVDGSGEALALVWNDEKFCFEPAEDFRHSETSPRYIGEILNEEDGDFLEHYGILGQKWGVRRYQNEDGTLTPEGRERYARNAIEYDKTEGKLYKKVKKNKDIKAFNEQYKKDHPELQKAIEEADEYSKARYEYLQATFMQPGNRFILDLPPEQQQFYIDMALDIWVDTSPDAKKFAGLNDRYNKAMRAYEKAAHKYIDDLLGDYSKLESENPERITVDIKEGKSKATSIGDELVVEMIRSIDEKAWKGRIDHSDIDSDQNELYHEGRGHLDGGRSGRYPWGSGADPYQRSELGSARAAAEGILNRAGSMPTDKFLNNGILDVSTVANNAVDNGRPLTSKNNQVNAAAGAAYSLAANPSWENAAKVVPKAIVDSGTRGWTEHDFDGIPTEIIKQSNERSAAIKAYKGFHGESTPVSDGAAKAAKVASLGLTAIAFIKLVEGLKGKGGSP